MTARDAGGGAATSIDLRSLAPVRRARWGVKDNGRVVVERPRPTTRGLRGLLDRISHAMSMPHIRLDETGSFAWRHLDGATTVDRVAERMAAELPGEDRDPDDEAQRLGTFVAQLHQLDLVALPGVDGEEKVAAARSGTAAAAPDLEFE